MVRNPIDALIAEFNRIYAWYSQSNGVKNLQGYAPIELFKEKFAKELVQKEIDNWNDFHQNLLDFCNPKKCLFVFFEDLQKDLISEMTVVLRFLGFDMKSGMESCLLSFTNDNFKRERRPDFEIKEILKMFTSEEIHSFEMAYMKIKNGLKFEAVKQKVL